MAEVPADLLRRALRLAPKERIALAHQLLDSLDDTGLDESEVEQAWRTTIMRRLQEVRDGSVELRSWEEVKEELASARLRHEDPAAS